MISAVVAPAKDFPSAQPDACVGSCADRATGVGCFPHRRFGRRSETANERARRVAKRTTRQPSNARANQPPRRRKQSHGELLLGLEFVELLQCALVLALGFLPLGVIHWADPTMKLNPARIALRVHRPRWTRTGVAAVVAHWLTDLFS